MNILMVHGSMRKGNTYALAQEIKNRLAAKPEVTIQEFHAGALELPFCTSCHLCLTRGEEFCPHYAHMRELETALLECDGVILCGAVYMWALNAAMKNILDHLSFLFHRPSLFGKAGMVIATATGTGDKNVTKYLKTVLGQWGINRAVTVRQTEKSRALLSAAKQSAKLDAAAETFYRQIKSGKPLPPSLKSIAVHNAFRATALGAFSASVRDRQYWQQTGFRDKPYPVPAGRFRTLLGAAVYSAATRASSILARGYHNTGADEGESDDGAQL